MRIHVFYREFVEKLYTYENNDKNKKNLPTH